MKLLFILSFFSIGAFAETTMWKEGLHLLAGGGANISNYHREGDLVGAGLHFKTDVSFSFKKKWAIETGSFVRFNHLNDTFIWDTLLTVGVRRRFAGENFLRVFAGRAPTVFFTDDAPDVYRRTEPSRIIYTGPVYGLSWGRFIRDEDKTDWFWEISGHYQFLKQGRGVKEGTVPEVVFVTGREKIQIYSLSVSFGLLVF